VRKILFYSFLFFPITIIAQNEASNWYFGYGAGLKFDLALNSVNSVSDGTLFTNEGCTTISDSAGNLLFYTDGSVVTNKNHVTMPNGNGLFGDASSSQSAIIVPKPDDINIYYVFTVDNNLNGADYGLNYSVVDMSLDGGLGEVTTKNRNLLSFCSEKLSAVLKDCITKSIWVITYASPNGDIWNFNNTFHAFEVSDLGVNPISIKSQFSTVFSENRGYLKLSPDGTKLACANVVSDALFLYDFDANTGIVSNEQQLFISSPHDNPYGVEFSQNNQFLYVHTYNDFFAQGEEFNNPENHFSSLIQFDVTATDVQSTEFELDRRQLYRGALQLGPNGKIYRALSASYLLGLPNLGVINNPNVAGDASNYMHNAVDLSPNLSSQGLPPFIQSLFNTQIDIIQNGTSTASLALCEGEFYTLVGEEISGASYSWSQDGTPLSENDHDLEINSNGHYKLYINPNDGSCTIEGQAFVAFQENPIANNLTLLQCDEDGLVDGFTKFNLSQASHDITGGIPNITTKYYINFASAKAENDDINSDDYENITNPETVYVRVTNDLTGCYSFAELTLDVSSTDSNNAELIVCDDDGIEDGFYNFMINDIDSDIIVGLPGGLEISYYETYDDALLEIQPLGITYNNKIEYSDKIFARVENENNCYGISELKLTVQKLPNIESEFLTYYCLNNFPKPITLDAGIIGDSPSNYSYDWSTSETGYEINTNQTGSYSVIVTNSNGCTKEKIITVETSNIATIESVKVVDASQNNVITVLVSGEGIYDYALLNENGIYINYQTSNSFENIAPGIYTVSIRDLKNDCGLTQDLISVIGFPKYFTPNQDGIHDTWQVYGLSSQFQPNSIIYIYDRYGKLLKQLNPLDKGWNGTFNGEILPNDDYWFSVKLQDGRIFKNHFSLKR